MQNGGHFVVALIYWVEFVPMVTMWWFARLRVGMHHHEYFYNNVLCTYFWQILATCLDLYLIGVLKHPALNVLSILCYQRQMIAIDDIMLRIRYYKRQISIWLVAMMRRKNNMNNQVQILHCSNYYGFIIYLSALFQFWCFIFFIGFTVAKQ